jgi:Mrp family chromosome partitioning ATPase
MGRMLEALKRTEEPNGKAKPEVGGAAVEAELAIESESQGIAVEIEQAAEESGEQEMPFIEVGGPRKQNEAKPRLETPPPRAATLERRTPQGVALQSCVTPTPPRARVAAELVTFHQPEHAVSQQYSALFDQLATESSDGAAEAVIIAGLEPGAGTTTAVLNLAIAGCSQHHKRIVVVDANLRRPAVAQRLGVTETGGLAQILLGQLALEKAVRTTPIEHLHILTAGSHADAAQTSSDAVRWIVGWLRERFDLVLIDGPVWAKAGALEALIPSVGTAYLVVDAGETAQPAIRAATRDLARLGCRVGGLIVTK